MLLEELLSPISPENPCGDNLEYDPDFVMLHAEVVPKETAQYGDFVGTVEAINWIDIERRCRALMLRTRDLRLAVLLLRCRVRLGGAQGLVDGLLLLQGLLDQYSADVHPLMVIDGEHDAMMRANALASLVDHSGLLSDMRELSLGKSSGLTLRVRDVEKSLATPRIKDAVSPETTRRLLKDLVASQDKNLSALAQALQTVERINAWSTETLLADAPDLSALIRLLTPFSDKPVGESAVLDEPGATVAGPGPAKENEVATSTILSNVSEVVTTQLPSTTRQTALAMIIESREWFEKNEPSSPVSVLLRQAERLVGRRYIDVVNAIPAELLLQWDAAG